MSPARYKASRKSPGGKSISIKRVYEPASRTDGRRFLVERLWPRVLKKEALEMDAWLKDAAPSTALRQWFGHKPERWTEFRRRYERELSKDQSAWRPILDAAKEGNVTLLYSARDVEHNGALVLRDYLVGRVRSSAPKQLSPRPGGAKIGQRAGTGRSPV